MVTRAIIWDFDGTLGGRPGGWSGVLVAVIRNAYPEFAVAADDIRPFLTTGFPWKAPENTHSHTSPDEWWDDLLPLFARAIRGAGLSAQVAFELAGRVRREYLDLAAWQTYPDSIPTLEEFTRRGWSHILLSNHVPELPLITEYLRLSHHFAACFNSGETGIEKPNPRAFRQVTEWAGPGAQLVMVGDNYTADILGAAEVGIRGILVRKQHPLATVSCETLEDLLSILD